jgi:hypothetical protein
MKLNPLFIIGSGSSAGAGLSTMNALGQYLIQNVSVDQFNSNELHDWNLIKQRLQVEKKPLEQALQEAGDNLSVKVTAEIIQQTWCCISNDEREILLKFATGEDPIGLVRLFKYFKGSNNKVINVITTNYDHLVEWSAAAAEWQVWDGFNEGSIGSPLSLMELNEKMKRTLNSKKGSTTEVLQHLRIYKPHGSLHWFKLPDGSIKKVSGISNEHMPMLRRVHITPVIVTPGIKKYLETHFEPYSNVFSEMKRVIDRTKAIVFIGFGFNDIHIQGNFSSALRNPSVQVIILAKELSRSFFQMIDNGEIQNYIAVQELASGSQVFSDKFDDFEVDEPYHWTIKVLLNQAWGDESTHVRSV